MDSSVSPKDEIWFLRVCHHISNAVYLGTSLMHLGISAANLHRDLQMEMVTSEIGKFTKKHEERLLHHVNVEAIQLLDNSGLVRRLREKPFELV